MRIVVADASALLEYLLGTSLGEQIRDTVRADDVSLHVPALCDVEVAAGIRRAMLRNLLAEGRAGDALEDYLQLPLTTHGHRSLLGRIFELRANFSPYDATYVALCERLDGELLTADARLERATRAHTNVVTLP